MFMWISLLLLSFGGCLAAQGPLPAYYREAFELLPASATVVTDPHSVSVTRTAAAILSIGTGASATAPQSARALGSFNGEFYTRQYTSANTLTSTAGGATGTIWIYALPITGTGTVSTSIQTVVVSNLGGTLACTGTPTCSVVATTSATARQAIAKGVYLASATMTAGSPATFDSGGITIQSQAINGWVRAISLTNFTGTAVTVVITDGRAVNYLGTISIAANTTYEISMGQAGYEKFYERGMSVTVGTAGAINIGTRWITAKLAYSPAAPQ